jgi:hypothetical protein
MTLDSHEIRLGNSYKIELGDGTYKIGLINLEDIENLLDDEIDDFYQALEISEEWLIKVGFKPNGKFGNSQEYFYNKFSIWKYDNEFAYGQLELKYAHQLENLYFALTGDELTYGC